MSFGGSSYSTMLRLIERNVGTFEAKRLDVFLKRRGVFEKQLGVFGKELILLGVLRFS